MLYFTHETLDVPYIFMQQHHHAHTRILKRLFLLFYISIGLVVFLLSIPLWKSIEEKQNEKAIHAADMLFAPVAENIYEYSGLIVEQVEQIKERHATSEFYPESIATITHFDKVRPTSITRYHASTSLSWHRIQGADGTYTDTIIEGSVIRKEIYLHALKLHKGDITIMSAREAPPCEDMRNVPSLHCNAKNSIVYVMAVFHDASDKPTDILAIAYPIDIWMTGLMRGEVSLPENAFIVDAEGYYLWHGKDPKKATERAERVDSSFYSDFPKTYSAMIAGAGETFIKQKRERIHLTSLYPAIERRYGGANVNIPNPFVPAALRFLIIGLKEK